MIVVDIETSGVDINKCGIWQIGAVDTDNPKNIFLDEGRIDEEDILLFDMKGKKTTPEKLFGKSESDLRDKKKKSQKELLINFFKWCESCKIKVFVCQNPQFDFTFLETKAFKYNLKFSIDYHAFDLHSIAQIAYKRVNGEFLFEKDHSGLGLSKILDFVGMKDNRKEHNALEDAKLTSEAFFRLVYGKNLLEEYSKFKLSEYIQQEK